MKVTVARHAGFCKGVKNAVDKALVQHLGQLFKERDPAGQRYQKFRAMGAVKEGNRA